MILLWLGTVCAYGAWWRRREVRDGVSRLLAATGAAGVLVGVALTLHGSASPGAGLGATVASIMASLSLTAVLVPLLQRARWGLGLSALTGLVVSLLEVAS